MELQTDSLAHRMVNLAVQAEASGSTDGWTLDSHMLWQGSSVSYSLTLERTERGDPRRRR